MRAYLSTFDHLCLNYILWIRQAQNLTSHDRIYLPPNTICINTTSHSVVFASWGMFFVIHHSSWYKFHYLLNYVTDGIKSEVGQSTWIDAAKKDYERIGRLVIYGLGRWEKEWLSSITFRNSIRSSSLETSYPCRQQSQPNQ